MDVIRDSGGHRAVWIVLDCQFDDRFRTLFRFAFDCHRAAELLQPFADAEQSEMAGFGAGSGIWIESAAIVLDGEGYRVVVAFAGDFDHRRPTVANRVHREFSDDMEDCVGSGFGKPFARHIEPDCYLYPYRMGFQRPFYCFCHVLFLERTAAEVP